MKNLKNSERAIIEMGHSKVDRLANPNRKWQNILIAGTTIAIVTLMIVSTFW